MKDAREVGAAMKDAREVGQLTKDQQAQQDVCGYHRFMPAPAHNSAMLWLAEC